MFSNYLVQHVYVDKLGSHSNRVFVYSMWDFVYEGMLWLEFMSKGGIFILLHYNLSTKNQMQQLMFMDKRSKGIMTNYITVFANLIPGTVAEKTSYNLGNAGNMYTGY